MIGKSILTAAALMAFAGGVALPSTAQAQVGYGYGYGYPYVYYYGNAGHDYVPH